jgi:hypothetical protein
MVSGDAENATAGGWGRAQLYRGITAIGNDIQFEGSAGSENSTYAMQFVDAQAAGTYTYHFKIVSLSGSNFNFGENTGPVMTAIELNSLAGSANLASNLALGAAGSIPYQTAANTTSFLAVSATNNQVLTINTATNTPYWSTPTSTFNGGTITNALTVSNTGGINTTGQFTSTYAGAPLIVSNTTVVANLNADLLDGYNTNTASQANTVVVRDASQNFAANTITATLYGTANLAQNVAGGNVNKGELLYQSGVNTTNELTAPATNMSALLYNTSTNAPYWATPPQAMTSLMGYTSTATAAGFTSLTNTSSYYQQFTGSTTQTVVMPNTATLATGWTFHIVNNSTGNVTANTFANAATLLTIPSNTTAMVTCIDTTSNTATGWEVGLTDFGTYTGTGSVVMNNTPTFTTPNIGAATGTSLNVTGQLISTVATTTAPLVVSSTTQVANLNVSVSGATSNVLGGAAGSLPYQSAVNTTTFLARTATNNSTLAFNSSTNAPFWVQPTLSNTYYAATTSAQLAGVISDETGSGNLVFGTTPTITPANAVAATSASTAGYIGMPQISVSANTAILATHAGKHIYTTVTGLTHTIPANSNVAFEIGTTITFVNPASVSLSIAITTDTLLLAGSGTTGTRTLGAYGMATVIKITSTSWMISGTNVT